MSLTARARRRCVATAAVTAFALTPLAAVANEAAEPSPEASPEQTPTPISAEVDDAPITAAPVPKDNEFSLGQSLQMRVGPDAEPNSNLANFRWSVNQLTVQGEEEGATEVPVPDRGAMIRSLLDFSNPPQEDGIATLTAEMSDGFGLARTVSLWPQDEDPPIELEASFTLDGEPIEAWDLVGKSGDVSATYTLTNTSTQEVEVEVENLAGETVNRTVEADVPMVGITKTLIPQSYTGLRLKGGTFGADGRGNNQVQFISLPFRPLSQDGTATFGWAARVQNATLPSLVVQVAPVYLPTHGGGDEEEDDGGGGGLGLPPPNLDPAVSQIQSGVAQLIEGLDGFANAGGGPDPLDVVEERLNNFFAQFGENLTTVGTTLDPTNPDGATALIVDAQEAIAQALAAIQRIEDDDLLGKLDQAASLLTPERAQVLASAADPINAVADNADVIAAVADNAASIQAIADNAAAIAAGIRAGCIDPPGGLEPALPPEVCDNQDLLIDVLNSPELQTLADAVNSPEFQQLATLVASAEFQQAADVLAQIGPELVPLANALQVANTQLPGIITALKPVLNALDDVLGSLESALSGLAEQIAIIGGGLEEAGIDLPTLDAVISNVVDQVLNSPPGQNVTGGLAQVGSGVGDAKSILGDYLAQVIVTLQGVGERVGEVAGDVDAAVVNLKAEIAGMVQMAGTSPLPYGGDPAEAPEGTVLAGAFEFRVDAADTNQPYTGPRILVGLVALIGAGALSYFVGRNRSQGTGGELVEAGLGAGGASGSAVAGGAAVGTAAAAGAAGMADGDAPTAVVPSVDDSPGDLPEADGPTEDPPTRA